MDIQSGSKRSISENRRASIIKLQNLILQSEDQLGHEDFPVLHHFAPGQYAREMLLPAGTLVVGKIHKEAHINVVSLGRVKVFTEHTGVQEIAAPYTFVSEVGAKRVVLALEDTVWTTVHCTSKTDLAEIEHDIIASNYDELEE